MDRNTKSNAKLSKAKTHNMPSMTPRSRIPILKSVSHSRPRYCPIRKRNTRRWGVAMLSEDNMKLLSTTTARLSYDLATLAALEGRSSPRSSSTSSEHSTNSSGSIPIILDLHHMLDTAIDETTSGVSEHAKQQPSKPTRKEVLETIDEDAEKQEQESSHDSLLEDINVPPIPKRHPARKRGTLLTLKEMLATPHEDPKPKSTSPDCLINAIASGTFDSDLSTIHTYIHGSARLGKTSAEVARMHSLKAERAAGKVDIEKKFVAFTKLMSELHKEEAREARQELDEKKREFEKTSEGLEVLLRVGKLGVY
ncbi:hypothetical protein HII31_05445 [Pseudocercospora fuligena]|uniref:Uncharacterized protein n=1 Tax=Pseudocercospora fuligena TaxID=685502 RepID=A0A8H6RLH3_9PEZI|nr:hypothetical protein HII31_05445 [Pseudocercospora fuligena]